MVRIVFAIGLAFALFSAQTAAAEENAMETVFKDSLYGGLAGALIGGAVMALTDNPGDHIGYIGVGAAVGVIGGAAFGLAQSSRAFAEVENGRMTVSVPTVQTAVTFPNPAGRIVERRVDVLRVRF